MSNCNLKRLIHGHDTLECAYYLVAGQKSEINFDILALEKEYLRQNKNRDPKAIKLGDKEFLLHPYGTSTGYSFVIENNDYVIAFGEFMSPSFSVKFKCHSLWQKGAFELHKQFLQWANSIGLYTHHDEGLSRVDFSFDYQLNEIDFDENNFVSMAKKDSRYRKDRVNQTFQFGKGDIVLRVYNKVAEIAEQSHKNWFFTLWETEQNVWRIEWQCRKPILKRFGILTFNDLIERQGDLLRYLAYEHDTLRIPSNDKNRSRWMLHPLWQDINEQVKTMNGFGIYRELDTKSLLAEKEERIAISVYGYLKRIAALNSARKDIEPISMNESFEFLKNKINKIHEPFLWKGEVQKRIHKIRLGQ
jgi:hypothetical protein